MCFQKKPFISEVSSVYVNIETVYEMDKTERILHKKVRDANLLKSKTYIYVKKNDCLGKIGKYCAEDFYDILNDEMEKNVAIDDIVLTIVRKGYLLSGNRRHACKEYIRINDPVEYDNPEHRPLWNGTYAQLYVGLSPHQARYMSYIDNERSKTQSTDIAASKIEVNDHVYCVDYQ